MPAALYGTDRPTPADNLSANNLSADNLPAKTLSANNLPADNLPAEALAKGANEMPPDVAKTVRFLHQAQQQVAQAQRPKVASLTFPIRSIEPWSVLSILGRLDQRHFYYDSPQQWALVGIGSVVGCSAAGSERFAQAQAFTQAWKSQFIHAETSSKADLPGRFFCSATFFDAPTQRPSSLTTDGSAPDASAPDGFTPDAFAQDAFAQDAFAPDSFEPVYIFVPQVQVMTLEEGSNITFNTLVEPATQSTDAQIYQIAQSIHAQLQQINESTAFGAAKQASRKVVSKDVASFEGAVTGALAQIKAGQMHKVVLADVMDVEAQQAIDVVRSLQTLRQNHPDCTVFSVGNGKGQSFIGASPERLLSINKGRLTTDALAGSASRGKTSETDTEIAQSLINSKKERYEHQVVVEFIVSQLRSLGLEPNYTTDPQLLRLLHIQHLHTPITASLNTEDAVSPLKVLAKLHPTPAVAGLPIDAACELIKQQETFERGLYAAPVGWIDTKGNSEFIVGIRSALIDGCRARLYAGAGIVSGSKPEKELAEITLKLQTLLNALV